MSRIHYSFIATQFMNALARCPHGTLVLNTPEGESRRFVGSTPEPVAQLTIRNWECIKRIAMRGDIGLGESYADGQWDSDDVAELIAYFLHNLDALEAYAHGGWLQKVGFSLYNTLIRRNSTKGSRENIRAHYDVGNDFYQLWLDPTMTYSSALRTQGSDDLPTAQAQKYGRILDRIGGSGAQILEIGCGWGGFAEQAATHDHTVTGLTISAEQFAFATDRLKEKANIVFEDYRKVGGLFDAIVSIEMFEAVGERYWPSYFSTIKDRLNKGGKAIIQTITIDDDHFEGYRKRSDYIRHYVFPGGMLPSRARFEEQAKKAGLAVRDVFAFGQDYAWTLDQWRNRFTAAIPQIKAMGYSESFIRGWLFYLNMCMGSFKVGRTDVIQVELVHA